MLCKGAEPQQLRVRMGPPLCRIKVRSSQETSAVFARPQTINYHGTTKA